MTGGLNWWRWATSALQISSDQLFATGSTRRYRAFPASSIQIIGHRCDLYVTPHIESTMKDTQNFNYVWFPKQICHSLIRFPISSFETTRPSRASLRHRSTIPEKASSRKISSYVASSGWLSIISFILSFVVMFLSLLLLPNHWVSRIVSTISVKYGKISATLGKFGFVKQFNKIQKLQHIQFLVSMAWISYHYSNFNFFKDWREFRRPCFDLARANVCNRRLAFFGDLNRWLVSRIPDSSEAAISATSSFPRLFIMITSCLFTTSSHNFANCARAFLENMGQNKW